MSETILAVNFDTETTGNMPDQDGICQLAAVALVEDGGEYDIQTIMSTYCRPRVPIKQEATDVHGITADMLVWSPDEYTAVQTLVAELDYLERQGYNIVVGGHNIERFDIPVITHAFDGVNPFEDMYTVDTLRLARYLFPDAEHKLGELYQWYIGKEAVNAHDAAADCWMVCEILQKMCIDQGKTVVSMCEWCETPFIYEFIPFGKYKGMSMDEVPTTYLNWCQSKFKKEDRDLTATIEFWLRQRSAA